MLINSEEEMIELGAKLIQEKKIILLEGDLGAGKTTFTKWVAKWLNIKGVTIQSPTYTYTNTYEEKLFHMDMYRLESYDQILQKWIIHDMENYDYIVIERPKRIDQLPIDDYYIVHIKKTSPTSREVSIENKSVL